MTYKQLQSFGINELEKCRISEAEADAKLLLLDVIGINLAKLYMIFPKDAKNYEVKKYIKFIKKRKRNIPIQYILGKQEFMSLPFIISKDVLIPRQDTEILVEYIIKKSEEYNDDIIKILDIGTGSGSIAISLGKYIDKSNILATDISKKALKIASSNAKINNVSNKIEFLRSNLFKKIDKNKFNIIVSNPPYIKKNDRKDMEKHVLKEPYKALFSSLNGFYHIEKIIKYGKEHLHKNGLMALEVGINQCRKTIELFKENGYVSIEIIKDYNGIDRVVSGKV